MKNFNTHFLIQQYYSFLFVFFQSAILVMILGLIMLNRGLSMLGSQYSFSAIQLKLAGNSVTGGTEAAIVNGFQEINMDVSSSGYSPNSFVLKKGIPVKWNINVKELTNCNREIIVKDYGLDIKLKNGLNIVEFIPEKIGIVRWSCGMGMLRGSFIVTESGTASREQIAAAKPSGGGSCSMGTNGGGCGCK